MKTANNPGRSPQSDRATGTQSKAGSKSIAVEAPRYGLKFVDTGSHADSPIQRKKNDTGLPDQLKSGIESLSGLSMDSVKVHYNSSQPAQLNALAYTQGNDIHVAPGQERHLPHEAWHVVQQAQGRVTPKWQAKGVAMNNDKGLEQEADVMAHKALQSRRSAGSDPSARRGDDAGTLDRHTEEIEDKSSVQRNGQHPGRTRAPGLLTAITPTVQCQLSVNAPIDPGTIANVERLSQEKLVFRLTDRDGFQLIVKAEGKVRADESVEEMRIRFSVGQYAAKRALGLPRGTTPDMELLDQNELDNLAQNLPDLGDAPVLKNVLTQQDHIFYKAEMLLVGGSLLERGNFQHPVSYTQERIVGRRRGGQAETTTESTNFLHMTDVWETWGRIALLDLLTDNQDRFPFSVPIEEAAPNFENLDFSTTHAVLAFDNLDKAALMTKGAWRCAGSLRYAKSYCSFFARNICERWRIGGNFADLAEKTFWQGFLKGRKAMRSAETIEHLKRLKENTNNVIRAGTVGEFIRRIGKLSDVRE